MDISWLGGSCFRLHASGLQILTDPFDLPLPVSPLPGDIVTLSRRAAGEGLAGGRAARVIDGPGEYEIRGVPITGIATSGSGAVGGRNVAYTMGLDGVTVCHLGRVDQPVTASQLQEIGSPDVLLLPIGEHTGLSVTQAAQLTSQLEARLLAPVPLRGEADEAVVERFCRELGADPANFSPRLTVSTSGLPAQVQVVRLSPAVPPAGSLRPAAPSE